MWREMQQPTKQQMTNFLAILILSFTFLPNVFSFNVDVGSKVIHTPPKDSCDGDCMFGFAVAQHKDQGTPWLLIGAPEAESGQENVQKGGAVYKCPPDAPGRCDLIKFDTQGDTEGPQGHQLDEKSGQWFGALVRSSGDNGVILACAPRYVWYSRNYKRREPVGTCYTARNNFAEFSEYSPCRTRKWGYHRQGSCQAGLGAAIAKDGNQIFIGAVGSFYWQGQVFSQKLLSLTEQLKTAEGSPNDDDSYLGYSVTTGDFDGNGDRTDVAVGMPRGANLTGTIVLYNSNLTNLYNISGEQIGAYFGYSVAAGDFNGDGLDDLAIGSPMWTNYAIMGKYETGLVTLAYQKPKKQFSLQQQIEGTNHKARFGLSVACAGNINLDGITNTNKRGYEDLVVGAPYDGPDGQGAIYVFLGSSDGLQKAPAQVIFGRDIDKSIRTFGWSLSGGMDLDNNEYPDLLIGAYESTNAVYLRSAPVVHLDSKVSFLVSSKQVNLDNKNCVLSDRTQVPCVETMVELRYSGVGVPNSVDLNLQYILDAKKENTKRLFFHKQEGTSHLNKSVTIKKEKVWTEKFFVYLPATGILDKLTSIDIQVKCSLNTRGIASSNAGLRGQRSLTPVLGHDDRFASDSISIQKNCGTDNNCIPNLSMDVSHVPNYIMGSGEKLEITVDIKNSGEDAFSSVFFFQVPKGVNYFNANSSSGICSAPSSVNNNTIQCDIGNPLPANSKVTVRVFLQPIDQDQEEYLSEYLFYLAVNSSNPEKDYDSQDNHLQIRIPVSVTAELRLSGAARPNPVEYNTTAQIQDKLSVEDEIGQEIFHVYELKNRGPSTILESEIYILWPSLDESQNHLLYLLGLSHEGSASVTCEQIPNVNPLYIKANGSRGYAEAYTQAEAQGRHFYGRSDVSVGRSVSTWSSSGSSSSKTIFRQSSSGSGSGSVSTKGGSSQSGRKQTENGGGHYQTSYEYENRFKGGASRTGDSSTSHTNYGRANTVETVNENNVVEADNEYEDDDLLQTQQRGSSTSSGFSRSSSSSSRTEYGHGGSSSTDGLSNGGRSTQFSSRTYSTGSGQGTRVAQGWSMKEDGTYIRLYNTNTTAKTDDDIQERRTSGVGRQGSGGYRGSTYDSTLRTAESSRHSSGESYGSQNLDSRQGSETSYGGETRLDSRKSSQSSSSSDKSLNAIFGAAQGPGDYHGTMRKSELEKDAGGRVFSSSSGETRSQVETTRYRGGQVNYGGHQGSSSGSGGSSRTQSYETSGENDLDYQYGESSYGSSGSARSSGQNYGSFSGSGQNRGATTQTPVASGGGSVHYEEGSYYDQSNRGRYSYGGSRTGNSQQSGSSQVTASQSSTSGSTSKCNYIWSDENGRWECEPSVGERGQGTHGSTDSGWVTLPDGSRSRSQSSWSSWEASQSSSNTGRVRGQQGRQRGQEYYNSGHIGQGGSDNNDGHYDSGWVDQGNGSYHRRQSTWAQRRGETSVGGVQLNPEDVDELSSQYAQGSVIHANGELNGIELDGDDQHQREFGDHGKNSTGWTRRPDGTMVRKTSSWASWSAVSSSDDSFDENDLQSVRKRLEEKTRDLLRHDEGSLPDNVEPGFESSYTQSHKKSAQLKRSKRASHDFDREIQCPMPGCARIKCTVGPLQKDDNIVLKVRSRLFAQTLIKGYDESLAIPSKLVARVTRLPYQADPFTIEHQSLQVITNVFPSERGEGKIPWWVWLLAALGGLLLLALISYCLYKCGFFKRKRPDNSPELQPLNGYH